MLVAGAVSRRVELSECCLCNHNTLIEHVPTHTLLLCS